MSVPVHQYLYPWPTFKPDTYQIQVYTVAITPPSSIFLKVLHSMKAFIGEKEPVVSNTIPRLSSLYLSRCSGPFIGVGSN